MLGPDGAGLRTGAGVVLPAPRVRVASRHEDHHPTAANFGARDAQGEVFVRENPDQAVPGHPTRDEVFQAGKIDQPTHGALLGRASQAEDAERNADQVAETQLQHLRDPHGLPGFQEPPGPQVPRHPAGRGGVGGVDRAYGRAAGDVELDPTRAAGQDVLVQIGEHPRLVGTPRTASGEYEGPRLSRRSIADHFQ